MPAAPPSLSDPVARAATGPIGGPVGKYAAVGRRGAAPVLATLISLGSALVALGVVTKNHCVDRGWSPPDSLSRMCYSDLPAAVNAAAPSGPYSGAGAPGSTQPVVTAVLTWFLQQAVPSGSLLARQQWFFAWSASLVLLSLAAAIAAVVWMLPAQRWRAAHLALSPVLVTVALISLDLFGVALAAVGLAAWTRRRPALAGAFLGAAVLARTFPLIVVLAIIIVAMRERQWAPLRRMALAFGGTVMVVLVGAIAWGGNPLDPYLSWAQQHAGYGSVGMVLGIFGVLLSPQALTIVAVAGWVISAVVGWRLGMSRRWNLPVPALAAVMLIGVLLTGKANPVQSALWLLPLIAGSQVSWRDHLIWAGVEFAAFVGTWLYVLSSASPTRALPGPAYAVLVVVRILSWLYLAYRVLAGARHAEDERRWRLLRQHEELARTTPGVVPLFGPRPRVEASGPA